MAEKRFWHKEDGRGKIQDHYNSLADLFQAGNFASMGCFYNEASTIVALKSGRVYAGSEGAENFWKDLSTQKKVAKISFKIRDLKIISSQHFVPKSVVSPNSDQVLYQATLQKIGYVGVIVFMIKGSESNGIFSGGGFHRDDCQFGYPDDESYPF